MQEDIVKISEEPIICCCRKDQLHDESMKFTIKCKDKTKENKKKNPLDKPLFTNRADG